MKIILTEKQVKELLEKAYHNDTSLEEAEEIFQKVYERKGEIKKMEKFIDEIFNTLIDQELFTYEELQLITNINGYSIETLNDCIYSRYGYRDYNQMMEE